MNKIQKLKLLVAGILIILLGLFMAMNTEIIEVDFLIGKIEIRRSMMIVVTFVIGLFAGWALRSAFISKKKNKSISTE